MEGVARAQDESWAVAGADVVARGAPGARTRMLPIDRFNASTVSERCSSSPEAPDVADFAERAMRRAIALDVEVEAGPAEVELDAKARDTFVRSLMERHDFQLDAEGARRCLETVEDAAAAAARAAMGDLLVNATGPISEEEVLADALRRFNDDAEAAVAEAARVAGEMTAAEFNKRAEVDAAEEEERALALDRQRLEDILGRDGGLRRYLAEEARLRGDPADAYGGELDADQSPPDQSPPDRDRAGEEGRGDDDNFWAGVDIEDEDADRLLTAEEREEREREDRERKRREAREAERAAARAKLEKWASKGMDFGDYGDDDDARDVARKETGDAGDEDEPGARAKATKKSPTKMSSPMRTRRAPPPPVGAESTPPGESPPGESPPEVVSERPGENEASVANVQAQKPVNKWKMALAAIVKGDEPAKEKRRRRRRRAAGEATKAALTDMFARAVARREIDRDDDDEKETNGGAGAVEVDAVHVPPHPKPRGGDGGGVVDHDAGMDGVTIPLRESLRKMAAEPAEEDRAASRTERRGDSARVDPTYASTRGGGGEGVGGWSHAVEPAAFHAARPGGRRARTIAEWVAESGLRDDVRGSPDRSPAKAANAAPKEEAARSNLNLIPAPLADRSSTDPRNDDDDDDGGEKNDDARITFEAAVSRRERRVREAHARLRVRTLRGGKNNPRAVSNPGPSDDDSFELPDDGTLAALLSGGQVLGRVDDLAARAAAAIEANRPKGAGRTETTETTDEPFCPTDEPFRPTDEPPAVARRRIATLGLPPADGFASAELARADGDPKVSGSIPRSPAERWIDRHGSRRTVPKLIAGAPVVTGAGDASVRLEDPERELLMEEARREKTRRVHEALRARARRMRDKAALKADEDLLVKGRFNIQTIVPSPQTVKPPTREGTWARKEREYHEEKERRWKEEKMRVSVAIPIDDDDDDASDDSEGERRQRDVVSAAAARLWALAEANKRKGTRVVGSIVGDAADKAVSDDDDAAPADSPRRSPPRIAPCTMFAADEFAAEAGFDVGPPVTPETSPEREGSAGLVAVSREVSREGPGESPGGESPPPSEASPFAGTDSESGAGAEEREVEGHAREGHAREDHAEDDDEKWFSHLLPDRDRRGSTVEPPEPVAAPTPPRAVVRGVDAPEDTPVEREATDESSSPTAADAGETRDRSEEPTESAATTEIEEPTEPAAEIEEPTAAAETESEARIRLIRARVDMVRVDANRRARLSPRSRRSASNAADLWADFEDDVRDRRVVLAGSYAFVDVPYDTVAGPRMSRKAVRTVTAAIRVAVAEAAGVTLRREQSAGDPSAMTSWKEDDDDDDDRVRIVGISEGIPPEDVVTTGSRDGQTPADADRFGKCFVAHFELELEDPRGKKSGQSGGDRWSALRTMHASLVDAGDLSGKIPGMGRGALVVRGAGDPGAFPPPAPPPLARIIDDDDDDVRWAAVKEMAEPPEDPDAPGLSRDNDAPPGLSRDATRDDAGGVAPWEYRPLRALLGKPPVASSAEYYEKYPHSVPWGVHRERAPYEPRYVAPSLDDAMDKLVRVTDAHARRLADDRYKPLQTSEPSEAESRARELERTLRRAAADDDFFSGGGETVSAAAAARGRRSLAELDADAAAAARDLRAFDAGAGARKAARENVIRGSIQRESLEGTDPYLVAPGTLPTATRRTPLWDMGDLSNVDDAYDLEYVNPRQMRRRCGGAATTKTKADLKAEADLKAGNESDENDEYVNPRLSRLGSSSARSVA